MRHSRLLLSSIIMLLLSSCSVSRHAAVVEYPAIKEGYSHKGILEECFYECTVKGPRERRMLVYLPADYYDTEERYPVLYLLHGAQGNETSWIDKGDLLQNIDSLMAHGLMKSCIVVLPNTNQHNSDQDYGKSRIKGALEAFFENDGMVEYAFVSDVVGKVDDTYRTIPEKSARAIAGLSIGALQSIHITANHPDMFDYVGLFSPMVHPVPRPSAHCAFYRKLKVRHKVQFATAPQLYWVMIGRTDFFYPRMIAYHNYLERNAYEHEYRTTRGGHQWYNWEDYSILFMQRLWGN
ncbi:MAG: esterase family protein [Bacteroidaceae bacterium]|nr:esterase family protein [Bacteroidaceae bacterium]